MWHIAEHNGNDLDVDVAIRDTEEALIGNHPFCGDFASIVARIGARSDLMGSYKSWMSKLMLPFIEQTNTRIEQA